MPSSWPSPAEEELGDTLSFEQWLTPRPEAACLARVGTDSLRSQGIFRGDIVIIERGRQPQAKDIILVETPEGSQLQVYHQARPLAEEELRLTGVATAVIRKYH